jgi:hypothetical protein
MEAGEGKERGFQVAAREVNALAASVSFLRDYRPRNTHKQTDRLI